MKILKHLVNFFLLPLFEKCGHKLYPRINPKHGYIGYETIVPRATYAPWQSDFLFQQTFNKIKVGASLDKFQCFELWQLIEQSKKLEPGSIVEFSEYNISANIVTAQQLNSTDSDVKSNSVWNQLITVTIINQTSSVDGKRPNIEVYTGGIPEVIKKIPESISLRLCYVNITSGESIVNILNWCWDKMVDKGMFLINDYGLKKNEDFIKKISDFQLSNCNSCLRFYNLNGQAILLKSISELSS